MEMETYRINPAFITINFTFSSIGAMICFISLVYKLFKGLPLPKLWKYSICLLDTSALFLGIGLVMHLCILILNGTTPKFLMLASSSLMLFGYMDGLCSFITFQTILLFVQNPRKITSTSSHQLGSSIIVLTGIKLACLLLSILPVIPKQDQLKPSLNNLFPLYDPQESGGTYTSLLVICFWIVIVTTLIFSIIGVVKSQKKNSLVHDSNEDIHVSVISQGQILHKILLVEQCIYTIVSIMITRLLFRQSVSQTTNNNDHDAAIITVSIHLTLHGVFTNLGNLQWMKKGCCGKQNGISQESRQLKRLELLRTEHSGKHHFLASWIDNQKFLQTGLMKTYSQNWQKLWAQEIMVLGMLRKVKHPNLLQCLWTSNTNPYYEIVSLLSQDTVSRDSRIICMEFPEYGCLREYLKNMETPLSAATQCMIISDVSQGLQQLHRLDILHKHLSSIRVYLRGNNGNNSLFRASLGDFEYVSIFGSLLQGADNPTCKSRQTFFLPDIRSFALITLEMILSVCDKLVQMPKNNRHQHIKTLKSNSQSISTVMLNKPTYWQPLVKSENKTVVKGKLGYFPTASEESLHQNWSEMNPNSLDKSKCSQAQQKIKTIFVAPANANIAPSDIPTIFSWHSSVSPKNDDSLSSNISMLVEAEKDSESEISPNEFNDFISPYEDNKQDDFFSENKFIQRKTSVDSDPDNYHWSFFTNKHDYSPHSFFFNEQFPKRFSEVNNLNTPVNITDEHTGSETVAFPERTQSHMGKEEVNNMAEQDYVSAENYLSRVQRKNKARMNLQKTLTSRGMSFNHILPQKQIKEPFKKRKQFNDTQSQKPSLIHIDSSNTTLSENKTILSNPNNHCRPFNSKVNNDFRKNTKDYQFGSSSSYQTSNSSVLESSQNSSSDYTNDISCLSSATVALTQNILKEEKTLFQRIYSAEDIHRKIIDSGFETESTPSNCSNQIICHHNSEKHQCLENCFNTITTEEKFLPSSDDYLYVSNNNFIMQKKSCLISNQDSNIHSSPSNKNSFIYPKHRNGNSCSRSDEIFETSPYRTYDNKKMNQTELPLMKSELQNSNIASKRYKELKRRGVPLKISIVSSDSSPNFNQFSKCSPSISACSDVTTPDVESKNIFFPQQMSTCSMKKENYDQTCDDYQRKNSSSLFKQSIEDSPVFTTKVIGSPCPPTPTTTIPNSLFMTSDRPVLESLISCNDIPDFGGNWKIGPKGNNVQNQDTISVPSRQLSRLNSASLSHCSSLSHLSLPGKTIQGKYKLLPGVNEHHLGYCIDLVEKQSFLSMDDLLPASQSAFNHLKDKLGATGELTNAAKQLVDIVVSCWYVESPPLAAKLCEQLKDPVMETTV